MVPVPPRQLSQPIGDALRKPPSNLPRRISGDNRIGWDVLGDDGACRDHGAGADAAARQHDGAVPDPDIMADMDAVAPPPFEELGLVALFGKTPGGAARAV